ncbi:transposase, partial [Halobacillus aidingensis]
KEKLSDEKTGEIYGKRKVDVEPVFGFLKANLRFTRMSVRGKECVENELGFAFLAVNLRKYTARNGNRLTNDKINSVKKGSGHQNSMTGTLFYVFDWLCPSLFFLVFLSYVIVTFKTTSPHMTSPVLSKPRDS